MAESIISPPKNEWPSNLLQFKGQLDNVLSKLDQLETLMDKAERISVTNKEAGELLKEMINVTSEVHSWWDDIRMMASQKTETSDSDKVEDDDDDNDDDDDEEGERKNVKKKGSLTLKKVRLCVPSHFLRGKNGSSDAISQKIIEIHRNLDEILEKASNMESLRGIGESSSGHSAAAAAAISPPLAKLMADGFYDIHNPLHDLIPENNSSSSSSENIGVKVILMIGKWPSERTTTAKRLYNDDKVKQYFEVRRWVNALHKFVAEDFVEPLLGQSQERIETSNLKWEALLGWIEKSFYMKRFLVVLDYVYWGQHGILKGLIDSLKNGASGSIILLTASSEIDALGLSTNVIHPLPEISTQNGWLTLKDIALFGKRDLPHSIEKVGMEIAKKCENTPFDLKIIGSHLQFKSTLQEWEEVLHSSIWEMEEIKSYGYSPLYISYNDLPSPLQRCFLYVAVEDSDRAINVEILIRKWMAEGYLGPPGLGDDKRRRMKGLEYFNQLAKRSFFGQLVKKSVHENEILSFHVEAKVHEFANWCSHRDNASASRKVRTSQFLRLSYKYLRGNFLRYKYVREMDLSSSQLRKLPRNISDFSLLECLNLSDNPLKQLPETICDLYYLEFLDVRSCYMLLKLPEKLGNLKRLRHLRINHTTDELQKLPEKLKKLITLDIFRVGGKYNAISMLNVFSGIEEICIFFHGKENLRDSAWKQENQIRNLELCFVEKGCDEEVVRYVMALVPPPYLEKLKFVGYQGQQLPKWIVPSSLESNFRRSLESKLRRLTVRSALKLTSLPALGTLSFLEFLWLDDIPKLKHIGQEFFRLPQSEMQNRNDWRQLRASDKEIEAFRSLKTLRFGRLENLETWEDINEDDEKKINKIKVMPNLEKLIITDCPKLKTLPSCIRENVTVERIIAGCPMLLPAETSLSPGFPVNS